MFEARFQSFDNSNLRAQSASRTAALRAEIKRRGLDGFVVPRADRQQNEYLPASEERLAWLTGFTGSAGTAIVWPTARHYSSTAVTHCRPTRKSMEQFIP